MALRLTVQVLLVLQALLHEPGREPGWTVALCMFPARLRNSEWPDGD